ncbi:MAG: flagellar export protein FliJ [Desulfobacteraceae bacterium]|nr:flagellar export protein FliJ [Desulfobacteraceae bacterium]
MKPFTFRLDKILDYRGYLMKRAQIDLSVARNECKRIEEEIEKLSQKKVATAAECIDEGIKGIDVARYQIYKAFLHGLDEGLENAHAGLIEGEKQVLAQKAVLKKKSIKKKALEMLKEMQHKKHKETSIREEQKTLDEIVLIGREAKR